ncbi:MAG: hypothetical protein ACPG8W_05510 [Candidatus Promineifilaceae bacterium]
MIKVDRNRKDTSGNIIKPTQAWLNDSAAKTAKAIQDGEAHKVDETFYKRVSVKQALPALFHDKCAYCEASLLNVTWDVEHYRPKGRVAESPKHSGYYWLAYTWSNLFPACQFCNQRRKEPPRWGEIIQGAGGKADQFPLENEKTRVTSPAKNRLLNQEATLLLNPCEEDPIPHIGFSFDGGIFEINGSLKGKTTIDVCHLERRALDILRRQVIESVIETLKHIELAKQAGLSALETDLKAYLIKKTAPTAIFSAAARYVVAHPAKFGL